MIRERRNRGEQVTAEEVRTMLDPHLTDQDLKKTIIQLEKIATDAFIAHAVAANGQQRGEKNVRRDTIAIAKDAMRVVKILKQENVNNQSPQISQEDTEAEKAAKRVAERAERKKNDKIRQRISKQAKSVVSRSVIAAGLKRAALAPITSFIGSEVSAALKPTIDPIIQPILRPIQESIAQEVKRAVTGVTGLISFVRPTSASVLPGVIPLPSHDVVSSTSLINNQIYNPSVITHIAETKASGQAPHLTVVQHTGSSKLASPARISQVSSDAATPQQDTTILRVSPGASLSQTVQNAGLMSKDFNQLGSAREFYDRVIAPNAAKFNKGEFEQLTMALEKADTMGQYYQDNKKLFQNSWMEKLTTKDDITIALKSVKTSTVVLEATPPPTTITIPKGGTLLGELSDQGVFTEKELSTPGSAKEFYLRFIVQNPQLNAGEKLRFMESSTESFYQVASKKPEVYRLLSNIRADTKFRVSIPTQVNEGIPIQSTDAKLTDAKPTGPQLVESSPLQSELIDKDQSGVKWHFITDGTAGVMRIKLNRGDIRDVIFVPDNIAGTSLDVAKSMRFKLMGSIQTLLEYDEKDANYLLHDLDKEMSSLYASAHPDAKPLSNLLLKALLTDAFQKDKLLPTVSHEKGYIKDLFSRILKTKDFSLLEKINAYSLDQAMTRSNSSTSKLIMPKYEQSLRSLLDGVKSQSDLMEKLVKNPALVGMKMGKMQVSENKSVNEYFSDLLEKRYAPNDDVPTPVPEITPPSKSTILDTLPIFTENAPILPSSVTIESGDTLLSALDKAQVFSDGELKLLKTNGGGKLFFERIIQPNVGNGLTFTDSEGAVLQKIFTNSNANMYGILYDPKLSKDFTKITHLLPGQTWIVKPSVEQQQALELYKKKLAEFENTLVHESENQSHEDPGLLATKLHEKPLTSRVFETYLTHNDQTNIDLYQVRSVVRELSKEGLTPNDIEMIRELAKLKGITDFGSQLSRLIDETNTTDQGIANSLRVFIDNNHLANDVAAHYPNGITLLNQIGYDPIFVHKQILAFEGFDPQSLQTHPGIQKFGENLFVVSGVNGDMKQEFIAHLDPVFAQQPSSFEYKAMQILSKITSLPNQTFATLQKNHFYAPFIYESVASDEKQTLLTKLISDAKFFGMYPESEVVRLYTEAMSGNLDSYYAIEKILLKPGDAAKYLRNFKPSVDGNVLYQILRPDKNADVGQVLNKVKDYGKYLGLKEYSLTTPVNTIASGDKKMNKLIIQNDLFTLLQGSSSELPTQLDKSIPIDSLFHDRYENNIFVEGPGGTMSRLTGTLQETINIKSYPPSFIDILAKVENTQQTGDEFLNRILGRNILTGGLQKIDEILSTNIAGDRVLGGGSTVDMQLAEMLLGDPYSSESTSLFGRRPDLYGRLDYFNYLMSKIRSSGELISAKDDPTFQPNMTFQSSDMRDGANKDILAKITAKFETFLISRKLQNRYSHDEVIEAYLNHVPLGAAGNLQGGQGRSILGFQAASRIYFGKSVDQLSSAEQLVLVKIANSPGARSPIAIPQTDGTLHPALNSAIRDIESKFIPGAKNDDEKQFWLKQIETIKQIHFVNTVPDEWQLEVPRKLPQGTYAMFNNLLDGQLTQQNVADVPGVGYVMQLQQPLAPQTFGGVRLPNDYSSHNAQAQFNDLIENRFTSRANGGYEVVTDKGQHITIPSITQAYQDENGKWITKKTIGIGVVAVDADTLEPIIDYDPSHSVLGYAPPASTIKPFVASFLESKGIDINTVRFPNLPGKYALDGSNLIVQNHSEYLDHVSSMTLAQALLDSSNVPFQAAMKEYLAHNPNGWAEFQDFMKHFGIQLRNYDGVILDKPTAYSVIGTDVVVNMEDYARAYALLANPDKVFSDPNIIRSIRVITDHMTSEKSLQYIQKDDPYPIASRIMNGQPVTYFTKSGTESTNSLLNAGFVKSPEGKTVSIVTRIVSQGILFNNKGEPYATTGNLVNVLGAGQAWGSRTSSPISLLTAESIEKNYLHSGVANGVPSPISTPNPNQASVVTPQIITPRVTPTPSPTIPTISTPFILYGGRDSNWSLNNPILTLTPPLYTSQALDWNKDVNTAAAEIVTPLALVGSGEKPILLGHSFGANAVMIAAYGQLVNQGKQNIAGLVLEDPSPVASQFWDSLESLGKISEKTPVLLVLSRDTGINISSDFLRAHPNITVSRFPSLAHGQLPSDTQVQSKIAEWTAQLNK